jgi:ppGpp synthetase/RelA/SpoT-type nucleotidyltranferase
MEQFSKSQIDKLGERLRKGNISETDLRMLDEYRRSFSQAYESVVATIREALDLEPTGRPAKSTTSISEKLLRESVRLTQMQDIAGCRLIVPDIIDQEQVVEKLKRLFDEVAIVDRRKNPSHGYRAVHVLVKSPGKIVEIQVRTAIQHAWAEFSEKLSDVVDPGIKYGASTRRIAQLLFEGSEIFAKGEQIETDLHKLDEEISAIGRRHDAKEQQEVVLAMRKDMQRMRQEHAETQMEVVTALAGFIHQLEQMQAEGGEDAIPH